ncbi:hypothetical protein Leryth_023915 [Lithospermum erythrorhizon]|nr:hypothetical protein Leryth_023915 [Lithospermum erythrorhizon]
MVREQLQVLNALDVAKTQLYHFTAIVVAGMGFFTDAYDLFSISIVTKLLGRLYYYKRENKPEAGSLPECSSLILSRLSRDIIRTIILWVVRSSLRLTQIAKVNVELEAEEEKMEKIVKNSSNSFGLFSKEFAPNRHEFALIGTTTDMVLLGINITDCGAQTLIALCEYGSRMRFFVAFIDIIGRFIIQLMGFFMMTVFMFALAIPYNHWRQKDNRVGFLIMYSLTFFFSNFGPNTTTFVVPAEIFPARLRSTCHGISAAAGKAGAIVGTYGFLYASQSTDSEKTDPGYPTGIGMKSSLIVMACINAFGVLFTFLVPESKGKSLEEASGENIEEGENIETSIPYEAPPAGTSRTVPV